MDEITLGWIASKLWVLVAAWWWYDKKKVDARLKELESATCKNTTDNLLIALKLESIITLLDVKFGALKDDIADIKRKLD